MNENRRLFLLILLMTGVAVLIGGVMLFALYDTAITQEHERLIETAQSQARLLEAVARFDRQFFGASHTPEETFEATLSQIQDAHENFRGFGDTGEFTLAKLEDDQIIFLLSHRHFDMDNPAPVSFSSTNLAEPMRRALSGESGTVIGLDYRGQTVLAAYEPVAEYDLGIVAKIDLAEVQAPFVKAGVLAGAIGLLFIVLGALVFLQISTPLVRELEIRETKYRTLFETANDTILVLDPSTNAILDANTNAIEQWGYTKQDLLQLTLADLIPPRTEDGIADLLKVNGNQRYEHVCRRKDGTLVPVEISSHTLAYSGKTVYQSVIRDITERKQAQEQLELHSLALEQSLNGFNIVSDEGLFVYANPAYKTMWGYDQTDDLVGTSPASHYVDPSVPEQIISDCLKHGVDTREFTARRKDGSTFEVLMSTTVFTTPGGRTIFVSSSVDLTEQHKTEAEIHRLNQMLQALITSSPAAISAINAEGKVIIWNPASERIFGWTADEVIGSDLPTIPREKQQEHEGYRDTLFDGEAIHQIEVKRWKKDGSQVDILMSAAPLRDIHGNIMGAMAINLDISERKQMEATIRSNYERLQMSQALGHIGSWEYDIATNKIWGSDEGFRIYGLTPDETGNMPIDQIEACIPERERVHQALVDLINDNKPYDLEFAIEPRNRDEQTIITSVAHLVRDDQGQPVKVVGVIQDITARKRAQESLLESEGRFRALFEQAAIGVAQIDTSSGQFIRINKAYCDIVGYTLEEMQQSTFTEITHPDDLQPDLDNMKRLVDGEIRSFSMEKRYIRKDGAVVWVNLTVSPMWAVGETPEFHIAVVEDITERKQIEDTLRQEQELNQLLFNSTPAFVVAIDTSGKVLMMNATMLDALGYAQEEVTGQNYMDMFILDEERALLEAVIEESAIERKLVRKVNHVLSKNGTKHPVDWHGTPVVGEDSNIKFFIALGIDITKRRQAEEEAREFQARWKAIAESPFDRVTIIDQDGVYQYLNRTHPGISPEDLIGTASMYGFLPEDQHEHVRAVIGQVFETGDPGYFESYSPGLNQWALNHVGPIMRENRVEYVSIMTRDITEMKHVTLALQESEAHLRRAQQAGKIGTWVLDLKTNHAIVSQQFADIHGIDDLNIDFSELSTVVPAEDQPAVAEAMLNAQHPGGVYKIEHRIVHQKTGEIRWIDARGEIISDENGNYTHLTGASQDITDRKKVQIQLQAANERLRILHEIDQRIITAQHPEDIMRAVAPLIGQMCGCQSLHFTLFGVSSLEYTFPGNNEKQRSVIDTTTLRELVSEEFLEILEQGQVLALSDYAQTDHQSQIFETAFAERFRSSLSAPLIVDLELVGTLSVLSSEAHHFTGEHERAVRDIAHHLAIAIRQSRLLAEIEAHTEALEQRVAERTARLESKTKELEAFAYTVSHDLKAPLRGIDGYSRLLQEDYTEHLNDEGRTFLSNIRKATDQMNQLIDDMLVYSRLERRHMSKIETNLRTMVDNVVMSLENEVQRQNVNITNTVPDVVLTVAPEGLNMAIRNLVENALKFARDSTETVIEIGVQEHETSCILWVKDNGIGFDMQYHDRIFKIFQRLHRAEDYAGTGIGLAIVHKAMARMGGRVWAESEPGHGTTFYLELPR